MYLFFYSSPSPSTNTWPRQKRVSSIPKQAIDRCPSPMPLPRRFSDQNRVELGTPKLANFSNISNKKTLIEAPNNAASKENVNKQKVITIPSGKPATEVKRRIKYKSSPSPGKFYLINLFTQLRVCPGPRA